MLREPCDSCDGLKPSSATAPFIGTPPRVWTRMIPPRSKASAEPVEHQTLGVGQHQVSSVPVSTGSTDSSGTP